MAVRTDRKILALFADWSSRDAWAYVDGGFGWMQFRSVNFDAIGYMVTIAAEAKGDDRFVTITEDPVGVISQIYCL
jgi:hypothetical protein